MLPPRVKADGVGRRIASSTESGKRPFSGPVRRPLGVRRLETPGDPRLWSGMFGDNQDENARSHLDCRATSLNAPPSC